MESQPPVFTYWREARRELPETEQPMLVILLDGVATVAYNSPNLKPRSWEVYVPECTGKPAEMRTLDAGMVVWWQDVAVPPGYVAPTE